MNTTPRSIFVTSQYFETHGQHNFGACIKDCHPNTHKCTLLQIELTEHFGTVAHETRITSQGEYLVIFIRVGADLVASENLSQLCTIFAKLLVKYGFADEVVIAPPYLPNRIH